MILIKFLLFFILISVLIPVFRLGTAIYRAYHHMRGGAGPFSGRTQGGRYGTPQEEESSRGRRKVFHPDDGEYVVYEEVEVDMTVEQERRQRYNSTSYRVEEQITDAEWTEVK